MYAISSCQMQWKCSFRCKTPAILNADIVSALGVWLRSLTSDKLQWFRKNRWRKCSTERANDDYLISSVLLCILPNTWHLCLNKNVLPFFSPTLFAVLFYYCRFCRLKLYVSTFRDWITNDKHTLSMFSDRSIRERQTNKYTNSRFAYTRHTRVIPNRNLTNFEMKKIYEMK